MVLIVWKSSGLPLRFNIADGFATLDGSGKLEKHYQLTDWLGTPRVDMDGQGTMTTRIGSQSWVTSTPYLK